MLGIYDFFVQVMNTDFIIQANKVTDLIYSQDPRVDIAVDPAGLKRKLIAE